MTQHVQLDYQDPVHEGFFDAIQELLGAASPNFRVELENDTTLVLKAGTENSQSAIAVQGRYRWRTSNTTASLPGGLADGEHPVFVTASENDFGGPLADIDEGTDYTFGLQVKATGGTPGTDLYRLVGYVTVASGKITALRQITNSVSGAQIENGALSGEGDLTWTREKTGALQPQLKANSVGNSEIAPNSVGNSEMMDEAITDAEVDADNKDGEPATPSMRTLGTGAKQAAPGTAGVQRHSEEIGDNSAKEFTITHNFGTRDVVVSVRETGGNFAEVIAGRITTAPTLDTVKLVFATAPTTDQYTVTVLA